MAVLQNVIRYMNSKLYLFNLKSSILLYYWVSENRRPLLTWKLHCRSKFRRTKIKNVALKTVISSNCSYLVCLSPVPSPSWNPWASSNICPEISVPPEPPVLQLNHRVICFQRKQANKSQHKNKPELKPNAKLEEAKNKNTSHKKRIYLNRTP